MHIALSYPNLKVRILALGYRGRVLEGVCIRMGCRGVMCMEEAFFCKWVFITSFTVDIHFLIVKTTILAIYDGLIEKRMYYLN